MPLNIEQARFVSDMRLKIVQNVQAGRALDHGIDKERLKEALDTVRTDRSLGAGSKKGKTKSEVIPIDLDALMGKKS
jgi:hypothetical protein